MIHPVQKNILVKVKIFKIKFNVFLLEVNFSIGIHIKLIASNNALTQRRRDRRETREYFLSMPIFDE